MSPTPRPAENEQLSAIVVNWNGSALLADCLNSLAEQSLQVQIIVVDNGSVDDSEDVARRYGAVWLPQGRNTGLAAAYNTGADVATGDVLLFLNNDVALPPDFAALALSAVDALGRDVGAIDAAHFGLDGVTPTHERTLLTTSKRDLVRAGFAEDQQSGRAPCVFASGACFLITASLFRELGGWDPLFFAGWEDVDLSWRLYAAGHRVVYDPTLTIRHHVSATSKSAEGHRARVYAAMTGRTRFALKHAPWHIAALCAGRLIVGTLHDLLRSPGQLSLRARAIGTTGKQALTTVRWRRHFYRGVGKTPQEVWLLLMSLGTGVAQSGSERNAHNSPSAP